MLSNKHGRTLGGRGWQPAKNTEGMASAYRML